MYVRKVSVSITTDSSGDGTGFTPIVNGRLLSVEFSRPGSGGYDATADFTITTDADAQSLLSVADVSASAVWHPRQPTHDTSGVASLYASSGEPVESQIPIANDRLKVVVAQGGDTLAGTFIFRIG